MPRLGLLLLLGAAMASLTGQALAQSGPLRVSIGSFRSQKQCTLYAVTSGSEQMRARTSAAGAATPFGIAAAGSSDISYKRQWRTQLVRDCVSNFQGLRQSMEAAIAASGHIVVVPAGTRGAYVLSGDIFEPGTTSAQAETSDVVNDSEDAALSLQFSLRDPRGQVVHGSLITKRINLSNTSSTGLVDTSTSTSGNAIYTQLQREASLAIARSVAFKLDPLRVTEVTDRRAKLNYGSPYIALGATVFLQGQAGEQIKGNIVSSFNGFAWVETYGSGNIANVPLGSQASFAEADDPAANGRTYDRVDLP